MALELFMCESWHFKNDKFFSLNDKLLIKEDRKDFSFDRQNIDVNKYIMRSMSNGIKYVLHQRDEDIPNNRKRAKM